METEGKMRKKTNKLARRNTRLFLLYVCPWLVGFLGLTVFPMAYSLVLSFSKSTIGGFEEFIGFQNYTRAFTEDPHFWVAVKNIFIYVAMFVPSSLVMCVSVAMLLNQKIKGRGFFRVAFYLPSVTAGVAITLLWTWVFNPSFGLINNILSIFGIEGPMWLNDSRTAMLSIVIMNLWTLGNTIIIYLAGLQEVPEQLYESARIDGAGWWSRTINITIPLLTPTIYFNVLMSLISAFQMFSQPFVIYRGSGGPSDAGLVYMLHTYNNAFRYGEMGYGSALAWILMVFILLFTTVIVRTSKYWVHYSEG